MAESQPPASWGGNSEVVQAGSSVGTGKGRYGVYKFIKGEIDAVAEYAEAIVETMPDALLVLDPALRVQAGNRAFYETFEVNPSETEGTLIYDLGNGQWNIPELRTLLEEVLPTNKVFINYEVTHTFEGIGLRTLLLNGRRLDHVQLILLIMADITDRKQAEVALRENEARQSFLVRLNDAIRPLSDPAQIQYEASRVLAEHLGTDRAYYVEIDEAHQEYVVAQDWHRPGASSHARRYPLDGWPMPWVLDGETWVVGDVDKDPAIPDDQRELYRGNDIGACVVVPLIKAGRLVATLVTNHQTPRAWTLQEVALVEETAERTWAALERARVEAKLREAEERYLALFNAIDQGFCTIQVAFDENEQPVDYRFLEVSPSFERQTGIQNAAGRWMREIAPDQDEHWFQLYGRVALTGEPTRFEGYSTPLGRWWAGYAFRIQEPQLRRIAVLFLDITERKRAEEALQESEERYRTLFTSMDEAYAVVEVIPNEAGTWVDFRFLEVNPSFIKHTAMENAVGRTATEILKTPNLRWVEVYGRVAETGEPVRFEERELTLGRIFDLFVFRLGGVGSRRVAVLFTDITERKHAEEALRESEERLRLAVAVTGLGIFDWDLTTDSVMVNSHFREILGLPLGDEIIGGAMLGNVVHPEDRAFVNARITEASDPHSAGRYEFEHRALTPRGERWLLTFGQVYFEGEGAHRRAVRIIGNDLDVTERKQAEAALRESEAHFRHLAESVPDIVFTTTPDGIIDYVNPHREALTGHSPENALGTRMWPELIHPEDRARVEAQRDEAYAEHKPFEVQYRLYTTRGEYRWFISRARPIAHGNKVVRWFGTLSDVDALIRAETALREANETLEARVQERTQQVEHLTAALTLAEQQERQRVSQVLHDDLQQLLYSQIMRLQLLRKRMAGMEDAELETALKSITEQLRQAVQVTRTLVTELNPPILATEGLASALSWLAGHMQEMYGLQVKIKVQNACEPPSRAVHALIVQMTRELLFNVVKHARTSEAQIMLEQVDGHLLVHIEDRGVGFDGEAAMTSKTVRGGFGLRSIAERLALLGGWVGVQATPGEGSHITLAVPCGTSQTTHQMAE